MTTVCPQPGCPNLQPCQVHKKKYHRLHNERSNHRYSNTEYRRARAKAWKRDRGRCRWQGCGTTKEVSVHHIKRIEDGGRHEASNLVCLCRKHHEEAERIAKEKSRGVG